MRLLKAWWPLLLILCLAAAYRIYLTTLYYGWEESDYGNLAMARGVLDSNFTDYDLKHLPFYYFLSALTLSIVGDTIVATHLVSGVTGVLAVGLGYLIARRVFDEWTGRLVGLLLCFQPEFALYSSSSLREPVFTFLVLLGLFLLLEGKSKSAALATTFSFLTRFDSMAIGMPAVVWHLIRRPPRLISWRHPLWGVLGVFALGIGAWTVYCGIRHDTWLFFMPTVQINIDTGGVQETIPLQERLLGGLRIDWALLTHTFPRHLSLTLYVCALVGLWQYRRDIFARTSRGTLSIYLLLNTGFLLGIGMVGQHEPDHNLYWKWLFPMVPYWSCFGAATLVNGVRRLPNKAMQVCIGGGLGALIAAPWTHETQFQLAESYKLYRPQVELARWVEANVPPDTTMVFDNIPACYVNRKPHTYRLVAWYDVPTPPADQAAFADWLAAEHVKYVLWFKEEWTQAPVIAPFLTDRTTHELTGSQRSVTLVPHQYEPEYGFIFYSVEVGAANPGPVTPTLDSKDITGGTTAREPGSRDGASNSSTDTSPTGTPLPSDAAKREGSP